MGILIGGYIFIRDNAPIEPKDINNVILPTPTKTIDNTIKFDVAKSKVGDRIGNMTITNISDVQVDEPPSAKVNFKGKVVVTGKVRYTNPDGYGGESVCMDNLQSDSLAKIPKMTFDTRDIWFCFNNLDAVKKSLVKSNKENNIATVTIDNYSIVYYPREVFNTADFVSIVK